MQLETERLHGAGAPGRLSTASDTSVDAELTIAEQEALLGWLADAEDQAGDEDDAAAPRRRLAGVLANLPEALKRHVGEHLAAFKVPSRVFVFDEPLPRNAAGKLLRRALRDRIVASAKG